MLRYNERMENAFFQPPPRNTFFVGREKETRSILDAISGRNVILPPIISITGPAGIGKTALAREVLDKASGSFTPIWIDTVQTTPREFGSQFRDIRLRSALEGSSPRFREPFVIVLDGTDSLKRGFVDWLEVIFNIKLVKATVVTDRAPVLDLSRFSNRIQDFRLQPLSENEVRYFFLKRISYRLSDNELTLALGQSGGVPAMLEAIAGLCQERNLSEVLSRLSGNVFALKESEGSRIIEAVRPEIVAFSGQLIHQLKKTPDAVYDITARQFEEVIADIFCDLGFQVELTRATRDKGRDILAHLHKGPVKLLCLIEAKKYRKDRPVGVGLVRNLYGTFCDEQANHAMLITTSYFSREAQKLQHRHEYQLSLKDYTDVVKWIMDYRNQRVC